MKNISNTLLLGFSFLILHLNAQTLKKKKFDSKPKLIVGIVVDQMRYDYLYRYLSKYGKGGFRRLMNEGFNETNTVYPFIPTATGPGHSCIFSGSIPALDGIIDNEWYSRSKKNIIYCVSDTSVISVGSSSPAGLMSPRNLLVTTIGDQLKLSNNFKSKVIGISQKDRASILPAGHTANAAYWLDGKTGYFISSSYYLKDLPEWVNEFNRKGLPSIYLNKDWDTVLPLKDYTESDPDEEPYETIFPGEIKPTFPHQLSRIDHKDFDLIRSTPFGNDLTKDFTIETIKNEKLGKSGYTDLLTLSFSSTDYIGHEFGPNSIEVEDTYIRLDKDLEEILNYLDAYIGKEQVLVFLTADHGVASTVGFNLNHKIPAGLFSGVSLVTKVNDFLSNIFGKPGIIEKFSNDQFYLNYFMLENLGIKEELVFSRLRKYLLTENGIANLVDLNHIDETNMIPDELIKIKNGYNPKRSGDFQLIMEPNWMMGRAQGTNHGTSYHYDNHVPLLWYGWKILPGKSKAISYVTDIASTLSSMLEIEEPNGSIGKVLDIPLKP